MNLRRFATVCQGNLKPSVAFRTLTGRHVGWVFLTLLVGCDATPPALTSLQGDATKPACEGIPLLNYEARDQDYNRDHPDLPGPMVSFNTLTLVFAMQTTVGEANALLAEINAEIVGGVPGLPNQVEGVLAVRVPTTTHDEMEALLSTLKRDSRVRLAVQYAMDSPLRVPAPRTDLAQNPPNWTWEVAPSGDNAALEVIRAPQMWNLNDALTKINASTQTGLVDVGYDATHTDLVFTNLSPGTVDDHGMHVAGTIGATYGNGEGIDGVNPYTDLMLFKYTGPTSVTDLLQLAPDLDVINISMGMDWEEDSNASATIQAKVTDWGEEQSILLAIAAANGQSPLLVVSAGNESSDFQDSDGQFILQDAKYSSRWANAALVHGVENIIVVESVAFDQNAIGNATRSEFSNVNGHISAPGSDIWSTVSDNGYESFSGTSMAAPHVSGLAGYMMALEPSLTSSQVKQLLIDNSVSVGGGASPRIDAWAAAMDIDRVTQSDRVLRKWLDIDDGTDDGNQRMRGSTIITDEDADLDGGVGDGAIDMADFRRLRDWLLQLEDADDVRLDGPDDHPKKDLNGNGTVEAAQQEDVYPRGDFNGDGKLSFTAPANVPGSTDLGVLKRLFSDPHYSADDLDDLLESGDIEVFPAGCLVITGVERAVSTVFDSQGTEVDSHIHTLEDQARIFTLDTGLYTVRIESQDANNETLFTEEREFDVAPGGDYLFDLEACSDVVVEITVASSVEPDTSSPVLIRAGVRRDDGSVEYQPNMSIELTVSAGSVNPATGATDADGFLQAELTTNVTAELITLFVTATASDGAVGTGTAEINVAAADQGIETCTGCTFAGEWSGGLRGFESSGALFGSPTIAFFELTNFGMPGVYELSFGIGLEASGYTDNTCTAQPAPDGCRPFGNGGWFSVLEPDGTLALTPRLPYPTQDARPKILGSFDLTTCIGSGTLELDEWADPTTGETYPATSGIWSLHPESGSCAAGD